MGEAILSLAELRQWSARTFDVLEAWGHTEVSVPIGHYWFMHPSDIWAQPAAANPMTGDSADDISTMRQELTRPVDDLVDWHSLQHLVGVLLVVASQIIPSTTPALTGRTP